MKKIEILQELMNGRIVKISKDEYEKNGEKTYYDGYFKIDKDLNVYSYSREINIYKEFYKRKDFNIDKLLKHIKSLENEGFKIEFIDILL